MIWLIPAGSVLTLAGIALLIWCGLRIHRAAQNGAEDAQLSALMQQGIAINLGGICVAGIGLGMVVIGVILT